MKNEKRNFNLRVIILVYLLFSEICFSLAFILRNISHYFYVIWYFGTVFLWIFLSAKVIILSGKRDRGARRRKRKERINSGMKKDGLADLPEKKERQH